MRVPILVVAKAKSVRVNFLSHNILRSNKRRYSLDFFFVAPFAGDPDFLPVFLSPAVSAALLSAAFAVFLPPGADSFLSAAFDADFASSLLLGATRFARGAEAAPPRLRPLLSVSLAGFVSTSALPPFVFFVSTRSSLESKTVTGQKCRRSRKARPCGAGRIRLRFLVGPRSTKAVFTHRSSGSMEILAFSAASFALAIAERTHFSIPLPARLFEYFRIASAWPTFFPRIISMTSRAFWDDPRRYFALDLASISFLVNR